MELLTKEAIDKIDVPAWKLDAITKFTAKMTAKEKLFPCIPATLGHSLNHLRYGFVSDPRDVSSSEELARLLKEFTLKSRKLGKYTSLIVFYETPLDLLNYDNEIDFENLFWQQLIQLTHLDELDWPSYIPTNPHNPSWEFCFHGKQYFVYCATPAHKNRMSRHFPYFMLAITPRWVLEEFHSDHRYASKLKSKIRERLASYDSIVAHPELKSYGNADNYEWKQYFLRDDETSLSKCPFHRLKNGFIGKKIR